MYTRKKHIPKREGKHTIKRKTRTTFNRRRLTKNNRKLRKTYKNMRGGKDYTLYNFFNQLDIITTKKIGNRILTKKEINKIQKEINKIKKEMKEGINSEKYDINGFNINDLAYDKNNNNKYFYRIPLIEAIDNDQTDIAIELLARPDINVKKTDKDGKTALMAAASKLNVEIDEQLLERKDIDVNVRKFIDKNKKGIYTTALILVLFNDYSTKFDSINKIVDLFLAHEDIDVNLSTDYKDTPLIIAAELNYIGVVEKLLAHSDIKVNLVNLDGDTALMIAAKNGHIEIVEKLLAHPDIKLTNIEDAVEKMPINELIYRNTKQGEAQFDIKAALEKKIKEIEEIKEIKEIEGEYITVNAEDEPPGGYLEILPNND